MVKRDLSLLSQLCNSIQQTCMAGWYASLNEMQCRLHYMLPVADMSYLGQEHEQELEP